MIISKKKLQEEVEKAREQAFNEAIRINEEENRFRYCHERIDRLEKMIYVLQNAVKPEEGELKCCEPVIR